MIRALVMIPFVGACMAGAAAGQGGAVQYHTGQVTYRQREAELTLALVPGSTFDVDTTRHSRGATLTFAPEGKAGGAPTFFLRFWISGGQHGHRRPRSAGRPGGQRLLRRDRQQVHAHGHPPRGTGRGRLGLLQPDRSRGAEPPIISFTFAAKTIAVAESSILRHGQVLPCTTPPRRRARRTGRGCCCRRRSGPTRRSRCCRR